MAKEVKWKGRDYIPVVTKKCSGVIPLKDIMLIEIYDGCVHVITTEKDIRTTFDINYLREGLAPHKNFCPAHSYLILNFDHVRKMADRCIFFSNGEKRFLGERNYSKTRKKYSAYISGE